MTRYYSFKAEMTGLYVNSSAYIFARFSYEEAIELKHQILKYGLSFAENLHGTILISVEGLNIRLSGTSEAVQTMQHFLQTIDDRLASIEFKDSFSDRITLPTMLVKMKKEAISMGVPEIQVADTGPAPSIKPREFKQWLDQDKDMLVLDTRNDYEVRLGTFKNAKDLNLKSFRAFPEEASKQLAQEPTDRPVVMFCTGGIRCEKASYYLLKKGFKNVYQLEGGILKYFETCAGAPHYEGDCYIFDNRVALTPHLKEADVIMCFTCRAPLTPEEVALDSYVENQTCCYCINGKTDFRHV